MSGLGGDPRLGDVIVSPADWLGVVTAVEAGVGIKVLWLDRRWPYPGRISWDMVTWYRVLR